MSNRTVIELGSKVLSFDFGEFSLDYRATDNKDAQIQDKAVELEGQVDAYQKDAENMNDQEGRKALKPLVDEFFVAMFDEEADRKSVV